MIIKLLRAAALLICASSAFTAIASEFPAPLPADSTLKVETLPAKYPTGWAFLNYAGDRIELRNVGSDSREVKGQLQARDSATLLVSTTRPELYIADTVWSRGVRGTRTDFITIYDTQTLNPLGEIVLPGGKRALITAMEGLIAFTDDQRMALVFNFTPASSVTVVDLVKRQVLGEIEIPGCMLVYPSGHTRIFDPVLERHAVRPSGSMPRRGRRPQRIEGLQSPRYATHCSRRRASIGRRALLSELARPRSADRHARGRRQGTAGLAACRPPASRRPMASERLAGHRERRAKAPLCADAGRMRRRAPTRIRPPRCGCINPATKTRVKRMRLVRPGLLDRAHARRRAAVAGAGGRAARCVRPAGRERWCAAWICRDCTPACRSSRCVDGVGTAMIGVMRIAHRSARRIPGSAAARLGRSQGDPLAAHAARGSGFRRRTGGGAAPDGARGRSRRGARRRAAVRAGLSPGRSACSRRYLWAAYLALIVRAIVAGPARRRLRLQFRPGASSARCVSRWRATRCSCSWRCSLPVSAAGGSVRSLPRKCWRHARCSPSMGRSIK